MTPELASALLRLRRARRRVLVALVRYGATDLARVRAAYALAELDSARCRRGRA
jgi:hypothetical protein